LDDTPLDVLASKILAQLARRDIWVQDVDVFEYKKNQITFKETKGGIVLKNKKFTLDTVAEDLDSKEIQQVQPVQPQVPAGNSRPLTPAPMTRSGVPVPAELQGQMPKRIEIFDPEPDHIAAGLVRGQFTPGNKYPIFAEQRDPREQAANRELPMLYVTIDDAGRKTLTPSIAFRPASGGLIGGNFESRPRAAKNDGLSWDGLVQDDVQDIRSIRR
jgi:hypothetical protein